MFWLVFSQVSVQGRRHASKARKYLLKDVTQSSEEAEFRGVVGRLNITDGVCRME